MYEQLEADVLVIGGGAAGMRAGIRAAELGRRVILLSKGPISRSGITPLAGEGITACLDPEDSPEGHFLDTLHAGKGLADAAMVRALAYGAPGQIRWLDGIGHSFRRNRDGSLLQLLRAGQSRPRNLFGVGGGWGIMRSLLHKSADYPNLHLVQDAVALRLLRSDERVGGAIFLDVGSGAMDVVRASATILATGGYEALWPFTDCPPDATGEGAILALEAGAVLVDLEMVQFYPTVCLHPPGIRGFVLPYEPCLSPGQIGGRLLNRRGEPFIEGYPMRDELTYAICEEVEQGRGTAHGGVYMDVLHTKHDKAELAKLVRAGFPVEYASLVRQGIDVAEQMVEVGPAAHFCCGGVYIDDRCATAVPGLFAAGECSGNVQGANRTSGNAIAETLVFGARAAESAVDFAGTHGIPPVDAQGTIREEREWTEKLIRARAGGIRPCQLKGQLRAVVGAACRPSRSREGLERGLGEIRRMRERIGAMVAHPARRGCYEVQEAHEARAMVRLAEIIVLAALQREESRGAHFRRDFPRAREVPEHTVVAVGEKGLTVGSMPVRQDGPGTEPPRHEDTKTHEGAPL